MFGKSLVVGQYIPVDSPLHRLDPRTKIIFAGVAIVELFLIKGWLAFLLIGVMVSFLVVLARVPFGYLLRSLRPILFLLVLTLILHVFFTPGEYVYEHGFIHISMTGLQRGIFIVVRLCLLIMITSLLTLTTSPVELTDGIEYLLSPFKRWGFPAHELAMMMTIAMRFIPTLLEEADRIMKAQKARGMDFESGNFIQRAKNLIPLLVPLFINSFKRADELAIAMESRCYRGGEGRTRLRVLKMVFYDYLFLVTSLSLFTVVTAGSYFW
ncbi:MAG: energy-coupling factor transport system permease protein [Candidatus Atribacteria bacterium]|jgi:energy-coupling factor transport system permease protein|uniref:Energy-coupling factor transporter transmembrane protein EcfT n=1 Tax=Thermatribacter velox TaxID=3039681 RepID=A0ABZ2YG29_9BACT|nr:energy-coupling factor transport system permease protein [Candidatus Atribacteria bacterium]